MSTERRDLEDWEKQECAALKAALAEHNAGLPKGRKLTQEEIAHQVGMSQGTLGSHLNGHRPVTQKLAVAMAKLLDVPISKFSKRLAGQIADMASAVGEAPNSDSLITCETSEEANPETPSTQTIKDRHKDPREVIMALFLIATKASITGLTEAHAKRILAIRDEMVHPRTQTYSALPTGLDGIAAAAFKISEEGGFSDDLFSMLEHGLSKHSHKEQAKKDVRPKKSRTERN
ncbi:helix-turn-helix domain-containing protein [Pseudomonas sp. 10S4]|uniref:helix-turn-helix domain-containing protein n=1 Tax=Pseudomonas sp. 10S4 TaxID=3048583 RepID=UPI002AC96850|nr:MULTISPECIES: helix-turn-helix transcriptional regulator [unclassified Pseudomonas]MEB0226284.1 helix-turn-helix transcriptional regulator [Pseudomonas sp. 5S1]MEB0294895.1 helix-turn-helix transcriptional regulator [Pseudomonas sp. 10S4]WPX18158.1 helix-turn-helix transcriptional regulator [Pseudomonas sp. 10S4]